MSQGIVSTTFDPVTWTLSGIFTIEDYLSTTKNNQKIVSKVFDCEPNKELKWKVTLYPNGCGDEYKGYIALYLYPVNSNNERKADVSFSLMKDDIVLKQQDGKFIFNGEGWGFHRFVAKDILAKEFLVPGSSTSLTVKCTIKYLNVELLFSSTKLLESSRLDIASLLKNWREDTTVDVTFKIKKQELKAHKFILASNSSVFRTMFSGNFKEKTKDVNIKDFDYRVMVALFDYIYTRKMVLKDVRLVLSLATAADKYDVRRLYTICVCFAMENLSHDNVVDAILFARLHDENALKQKGLGFLKDKKFKSIKNFAALYKYNDLLNEIFETI